MSKDTIDNVRPAATEHATQRLAAFAHAFAAAPLDANLANDAKRAILDWYAALVPGSVLNPVNKLREALQEELGHGHSTIIGRPCIAAPARTAALLNGASAHTVEFDDVYRDAVYHPGAPTIAAALAAAEMVDASGSTLLKAVIVGYEVGCRIGAALAPSHYTYWHPTGTVGTIGAAAAAGVVLGLDREQFAHALATATTLATSLQEAFRSDSESKPIHAGHAAEAGVFSALTARAGVSGAAAVIDGPAGFGVAMSDGPVWSRLTDGLGQHFAISNICVKNHACCGHTFAPIDAIVHLRREHALSVDAIDAIEIETYQTALDVTGRYAPKSPAEAKFSLPYVAAMAMSTGAVRLNAFDATRLADPALRALMQRVTLKADVQFTAGFPSKRGARVRVRLHDGRVLEHVQHYRKGDPELPMSDQDMRDKFFELATPILGARRADALCSFVQRLDQVAHVREQSEWQRED